jgi:hypothetical protein
MNTQLTDQINSGLQTSSLPNKKGQSSPIASPSLTRISISKQIDNQTQLTLPKIIGAQQQLPGKR